MSNKIHALDPVTTYKYILKSQREDTPKEDQIIWHLKTLSARENALVEDYSSQYVAGNLQLNAGTENLVTLNCGLMGVENFSRADGTPVNIERDENSANGVYNPIKAESLDSIPEFVRLELAQAIRSGHAMGEQDLKN